MDNQNLNFDGANNSDVNIEKSQIQQESICYQDFDCVQSVKKSKKKYIWIGLCILILAAITFFVINKFWQKPSDIMESIFCKGLTSATDDGKKWGFINEKGEWVIEPKYYRVTDFSNNGLAAAIDDGDDALWGYINTKGEWVIEPQFEYAERFADNGLAAAYDDGEWGFINKKGEWVIEPQFDHIYADFRYSSKAIILLDDDKYGYIDESGEYITELQFEMALPFSDNGLACVMKDGKYGYINEAGDWAIEPRYEYAESFSERGFALTDNYTYIDKNGEVVSDSKITGIGHSAKKRITKVRDGERFGYVDEKGEWIIKPKYDWAIEFTDSGFAVVERSGKKTIINSKGDTVAKLGNYDIVCYCNDGMIFKDNDKYGIIGWNGEVMVEADFLIINIEYMYLQS